MIHLAAYYDFSGEPSPKYDEITVRGTGRLLYGLRDVGFQVAQFVFSSTMLVHAPVEPGQFLPEDWPLAPTWAYPASKVRTEQLIRTERGGVPAVLLRIAGVYDDRCHSSPLAHHIQRIYERHFTSRLYEHHPARRTGCDCGRQAADDIAASAVYLAPGGGPTIVYLVCAATAAHGACPRRAAKPPRG